MHFSCLVVTEHRPDEAAIEEIMWPWCVSNEERRAAKLDYWEPGGRFAHTFSGDDVPGETSFSDEMIGPGCQLLKRNVQQAFLTYAVLHGDAWHEAETLTARGDTPTVWEQEFAALLEAIDPNLWLTIVDCHR